MTCPFCRTDKAKVRAVVLKQMRAKGILVRTRAYLVGVLPKLKPAQRVEAEELVRFIAEYMQ